MQSTVKKISIPKKLKAKTHIINNSSHENFTKQKPVFIRNKNE